MKRFKLILLSTSTLAVAGSLAASTFSCGQNDPQYSNSVSFDVAHWGDLGFGKTDGTNYSRTSLNSTIESWKTNSMFNSSVSNAYKAFDPQYNPNKNFTSDFVINPTDPVTKISEYAMPFTDSFNFVSQNNGLRANRINSLTNMSIDDFGSTQIYSPTNLTHVVLSSELHGQPYYAGTVFQLANYSDTKSLTTLVDAIYRELPTGPQAKAFGDYLFYCFYWWAWGTSNDFKTSYSDKTTIQGTLPNINLSVLNPNTNKLEYATLYITGQTQTSYDAATHTFGVSKIGFTDAQLPAQSSNINILLNSTFSNLSSDGKNIFDSLSDAMNNAIKTKYNV